MYAIRQHTFGPPETLRYEQTEDPEPGPGQVRIAVKASGVHLIDTKIRAGDTNIPFPLPGLPTIPGREIAGVVDVLGSDVPEDWLGQRVVAHLGLASAGYAELAVRDIEALHILPDDMDYETAVAMIGTGRTTIGILDAAHLEPEDVVLVTAAASGIGNLLVQAAHNADATVVGAAGGAAKVERVRELGATVGVDYTTPDWTTTVREALDGREITAALDGVGGELGRGALELLADGGRLILFGWSSGTPTELSARELFGRGLTVSADIGPRTTKRAGGLRALERAALEAAARRRLVPAVQRYALAEAAAAHSAVENRVTMGKTVLFL